MAQAAMDALRNGLIALGIIGHVAVYAERDVGRLMVYLNCEYYGIWDTMRNTLVD